MMEQLLALEIISRHVKDMKGIMSHEHELTQGEVMFDQSDDFQQLSDLLGEGRAVGFHKYQKRNRKLRAEWGGTELGGM